MAASGEANVRKPPRRPRVRPGSRRRGWRAAAGLLAAAAAPALAGEPIRDNSFLLEEAYNQEAGVVQHISTVSRPFDGDTWESSFTQEWPAPGARHQVSFTLTAVDGAAGGGLGDAALNYRLQLRGLDDPSLALAPRVSLLLPTGEAAEGRGGGGAGLQLNFPLSVEVGARWVLHVNAGATWRPEAEGEAGEEAETLDRHLGVGAVWRAASRANLLVEVLWERTEEVLARGVTGAGDRLVVSPGVRWAHQLGGLQVVPGLAFPIEVDGGDGGESAFLYLSFEHPFRRP